MSETQEDTIAPERTRRVIQHGAVIRTLRERDGYSITSFAEAIGISRPNLSRIESEDSCARVQTLSKIARQLRVPIAAITREPVSENGTAA